MIVSLWYIHLDELFTSFSSLKLPGPVEKKKKQRWAYRASLIASNTPFEKFKLKALFSKQPPAWIYCSISDCMFCLSISCRMHKLWSTFNYWVDFNGESSLGTNTRWLFPMAIFHSLEAIQNLNFKSFYPENWHLTSIYKNGSVKTECAVGAESIWTYGTFHSSRRAKLD